MDGVTILGATAAGIQLSELLLHATEFLSVLLSRMRNAPQEMAKRKLHVEQLFEIIQLVESCPPLQYPPIPDILSSLLQQIREMEKMVAKTTPTDGDGLVTRAQKLVVWVFKQQSLPSFLVNLEEKKNLLMLCIAILDAKQGHLTSFETVKLKAMVEASVKKLVTLHGTIERAAEVVIEDSTIIDGLKNSCVQNHRKDLICYVSATEPDLGIQSKDRTHDAVTTDLQNRVGGSNTGLLQEPISRTSKDGPGSSYSCDSLSNTKGTQLIVYDGNNELNCKPAFSNLPSTRIQDFIGRNKLLDAIDSSLSSSESMTKIVVLIGMGGSGKTQLALKYCQSRSMQGDSVFWIDATDEERLKEHYGALAGMAAMRVNHQLKFSDTDSKIFHLKEVLRNSLQRWVMVFDNYDEPSLFENIMDFVPDSANGAVIITSRHNDSSRLGKVVQVGGMHEEEALELLLRRTRSQTEGETSTHGLNIVRRLGFLPLAIDQAGSYIYRQRISLCDFIDHFEQRRKHVLQYTPGLWEYRKRLSPRDTESRLSVFTTWELAFQQLEANKKTGEINLIKLAGFLSHIDISEDMFQARFKQYFGLKNSQTYCGETSSTRLLFEKSSWMECFVQEKDTWDPIRFRGAVAELHDLFLIQDFSDSQNGNCRFSIHPLVSDWIKLREPCGQTFSFYLEEALQIVTSFLDSHPSSEIALETKKEMLTHMDECLKNEGIFPEYQKRPRHCPDGHSSISFGKFYLDQGRYASAEKMYRRALEHSKSLLGTEHPDTMQLLHKLGYVCHLLGLHTEAEKHYTKVLGHRAAILGRHNPETLETIQELANLHCSHGRYLEAGKLYDHVVESRTSQCGPDHPDTLRATNRLANNYRSKGEFREAERLYRHALSGLESCLGRRHPDTLTVVDDLGNNCQSQGRYAEAESLYNRALQGRQTQLGQDHPDTLWTMDNLANNYRTQGRYEEAEALYNRALHCNKLQLGDDHPETLWTMDGLARVYHAQKRYDEAEKLFEIVLAGRKRRLGDEHHNTIKTVNGLANVYRSKRRYVEAEQLLKTSLTYQEMKLGLKHPKTLKTAEDLAVNYQCQGQVAEAEALFDRVRKGGVSAN